MRCLVVACQKGFEGLVKELPTRGADACIRGKYGSMLLNAAAASECCVEVLQQRLEHGAVFED